MTTDPTAYPAKCTVTSEDLRDLKEAFEDDDHSFGEYTDGEWPPTDKGGNVFPIWFTLDDCNYRGQLRDSNGNAFNPLAGNLEPITREKWGACNAPLDNWDERYPEPRYCGRICNSYSSDVDNPDEYTYCPKHKGRDNLKTAEEAIQTGLFTSSVDHLYAKLDPWKKLVGWGTFESLMGDSTYEYAPEYEEETFDFSEETFVPNGADENGILEVKCGYPTDYPDRALSLYVAAMTTVQMMSVQPRIMHEDREAGEGMMETRSVEKAQLTSPTENDPSQQFKTIETWNEHHLNLPMSRLVKDRPRLLEYGGVTTDADPEDSNDVDASDIVLEIDAEGEVVETKDTEGSDPNQFGDDYTSQSSKIAESAGGDE